MRRIPERPAIQGLGEMWSERWQREGVYRFDRSKSRDEIYSIDTPPPTVSGELHVGHVFSYTHTDVVARYRRMRGFEVFYPMGFDDNGLPTERRVQNHHRVRCDPSLPYEPGFDATPRGSGPSRAVSRRNFLELCRELTRSDEEAFADLWRRLGLSVDWTLGYATIDEHSRRVSQRAFLHNLARGEAYAGEAPVLWDVDFQTAVAQAELEDRDMEGTEYRIAFPCPDGHRIQVMTTRPELLPACVALVCHPDDPRYAELVGSHVSTPLFAVEVPVVAHPLADPEKGTGIAQVCTFGDITDVTWWRELALPVRAIVGRDGHIRGEIPEWIVESGGRAAYARIGGVPVTEARTRIGEMLSASGHLVDAPTPVIHAVKFYEKGESPLEIVTSRQWYIRNGGRDPDLRAALRRRGSEVDWVPEHMRVRYEHWVDGLAGDWLISRQRFLGVPIPVWYAVDADGAPDHSRPILPREDRLPVDPPSEAPPGYEESARGRPGGFVGEADVMDTWATSSLTPQIVCGWTDDEDLWKRTFPMDLRPQAHDIIRTWLFATITRSHLEHGVVPWSRVAISGWIVDPERRKMSKSRGNVVTPAGLLDTHGPDGVRYWAARVRSGADAVFDEGQMRIGRRLAIKLLNAGRFVLSLGEDERAGEVKAPIDRSMLGGLGRTVDACTRAFEDYDYARALDGAETAFWSWTDDYLELVKRRAYGEGPESDAARSAHAALQLSLSVFLRLLAPFLPFVTEEVWSWWHDGSIHRSSWPDRSELSDLEGDPALLEAIADVLAEVRKVKTESKVSMGSEVAQLTLHADSGSVEMLRPGAEDLRAAARALLIEFADDGTRPMRVDVTLA